MLGEEEVRCLCPHKKTLKRVSLEGSKSAKSDAGRSLESLEMRGDGSTHPSYNPYGGNQAGQYKSFHRQPRVFHGPFMRGDLGKFSLKLCAGHGRELDFTV